jgi:excinuclease ABC subunit B
VPPPVPTSPQPTGWDPGQARGQLHATRRAGLVQQLTDQMMSAARELQFELAARLRDEIADLKKELRGMDAAGIK